MTTVFPKLRAESEDLQHLDVLRVVAALGVLAFHFSYRFPEAPPLWSLPLLVDGFFLISGIVIAHVYASRLKTRNACAVFLVKRFARLAPLHYATLAAYVAMMALLGLEGPRYDLKCIANNLTFTHSFACDALTFNHVSWSISAEMAAYVLAPAILRLGRHALTLGLVLLGVFVFAGLPWWYWTYELGWLRCIPSFAIGVGLYSLRCQFAPLVPRGALTVLCLAFVGATVFGIGGMPVYALVLLIVVAALAADTQGRASKVVRYLAPWGQLTYGIYMLHPIYDTVVFGGLERVAPAAGADVKLLFAFIGVPLTVLAAYASLHLLETPARKFISRKLTAPRQAPSRLAA